MGSPECHAFFLVGPTASGKSTVAQYLAEREGVRIVSADSMNVYRGMDVGTAKPSPEERVRVDYAGTDLIEPTESFTVADYLEAVRPAFRPDVNCIVAGGTGLYVKCLTEGMDAVAPENSDLRTELEALPFHQLEKRAHTDASELYDALTEDDRKNPRRLIRILERTAANEKVTPRSWNQSTPPRLVGLHLERDLLLERIEERVQRMYATGLLEEARLLHALELSRTAKQAIGYAEAFAVLDGHMSEQQAQERTIIRTRQLAKRQMTWFRNQLNVEWIDVAQHADIESLADAVSNAWKKCGETPVSC